MEFFGIPTQRGTKSYLVCFTNFFFLFHPFLFLFVLKWLSLGPKSSTYSPNSATHVPNITELSHFPSFAP